MGVRELLEQSFHVPRIEYEHDIHNIFKAVFSKVFMNITEDLFPDLKVALTEIIAVIMDKGDRNKICEKTPLVILTIGINGGGKTTSIGKMANMYKNEGKTVVMVTHDVHVARYADRIIFMKDGKIVDNILWIS
jgi:signal recognition particle GTPase